MIKVKKLTEALNGLISLDDFTADILADITYFQDDYIIDGCKKINTFKNWIVSLIFAICLKKDTLINKIKSELLKQATADYCKQAINQILSDKKIINKISALMNNNNTLPNFDPDKTTFIFDNKQTIMLSDTILTNKIVNREFVAGSNFNQETLKYVNIGNNVTSIYERAFKECSGLTGVMIGNSVTRIYDYAFSRCSSLTSVTIPDSVTSIGNWAFYNCGSLPSIIIPDSVTNIGIYAFSGCKGLTDIWYKGTKTKWEAIKKGRYWEQNVPTSCIVHCSDGDININI